MFDYVLFGCILAVFFMYFSRNDLSVSQYLDSMILSFLSVLAIYSVADVISTALKAFV